jgi:Na+-transporting methylmalonyl-CoA/oxaloacetate decarboxylase gamma subunit
MEKEENMENWFVVVMGFVTVFVVLILIIGLCYLLALACKEKEEKTEEAPAAVSTETIPNRAEFVAAVSAAIAEFSGTDASAIRIVSIKKL